MQMRRGMVAAVLLVGLSGGGCGKDDNSPNDTSQGGSGTSGRPWPRRWATTRTARHAGTGLAFPFRA